MNSSVIVLVVKYYAGDKMGGACGTYGGEQKHTQEVDGEAGKKKT
jgi:hypothetical protein